MSEVPLYINNVCSLLMRVGILALRLPGKRNSLLGVQEYESHTVDAFTQAPFQILSKTRDSVTRTYKDAVNRL